MFRPVEARPAVLGASVPIEQDAREIDDGVFDCMFDHKVKAVCFCRCAVWETAIRGEREKALADKQHTVH
jgi:hypothetical protein